MKKLLIAFTLVIFSLPLFAQAKSSLKLSEDDFYILPGDEKGISENGSGLHLFIRKKTGIESVMLVESSKDPKGKQTNYAYRAPSYNKINGDEIRLLDGKVLESKYAKYSLIDSTAEANKKYGESFHIYIPQTVVYGYPWSRNGSVKMQGQVFINIRTFSKKYCDYTGFFCDNAYMFTFGTSAPEEKIEKNVKPQLNLNNQPETAEALAGPELVEGPVALEDDVISPEPFEEESYESDYEESYDNSYDESNEDSTYDDYADSESTYDYHEEAPSVFVEEDLEPEPFQEEAEDEEEYEEDIFETPEEHVESDIPPEDRDVVTGEYDEDDSEYDPSQLEPGKRAYGIKKEAVGKQFKESLDDVDIDAMNQLIAEGKKPKVEPVIVVQKTGEERIPNPWPKTDYLITYDSIQLMPVEGKAKIPDLYISRTEITQKSYQRIMGENPSANVGENLPVDSVNYYEAIVFCNILSRREDRTPCYVIKGETDPKKWGAIPRGRNFEWDNVVCNYDADGYRLLTAEEWMYVAQGGINKQIGEYAGSDDVGAAAWYLDNSWETSHPVALKEKNPCGLYDMSGNLSEFVFGPSGEKVKSACLKGGNYTSEDKQCKIKAKEGIEPWVGSLTNGLRICRKLE